MNSLKKGEGIPLLNIVEGPGVPLLNFERGPGVPLLNFRGVPCPIFNHWVGSWVPGPGVLVPLLRHADVEMPNERFLGSFLVSYGKEGVCCIDENIVWFLM